ncbi:MAG: hypothetical protein NTY68_04205 [Candidatus Micrarchaeota archaeon]|nr:hypothetical protein [Candidatus Micrarchaeota archaeon]
MTRDAKGQVSLSFIASFAAIVIVVFIMFQGLLLSSQNITGGIEEIGNKVSCKENAIAYNIWKMGIPGSSTFYSKKTMVVDNESQYVICGDYKEEIMGNQNERNWI